MTHSDARTVTFTRAAHFTQGVRQVEHKKFEQWAVVEIMGHKRFAGFVTEETIGGTPFVRVDVPEVTHNDTTLAAFTKLFGQGAIYCISITTEETARAFAAQDRQRAFAEYEAPRLPALTDQRQGTDEQPSDFEDSDEEDDLGQFDEDEGDDYEDAGIVPTPSDPDKPF